MSAILEIETDVMVESIGRVRDVRDGGADQQNNL